jgi:PAS domain S-box-containing protein
MPTKTGFSSRQTASVVFGLAVVVLTLLSLAAYRATNRLVANEKLVAHTHEVQSLLEDVRSDVVEAHASCRAYLMDGLETDLKDYTTGVKDFPSKLAKLRAITADNPARQKSLEVLQVLVSRDFAALNESVSQRGTGAPRGQRQAGVLPDDAILSRQIVTLIESMKIRETQLLEERIAQARSSYIRTLGLLAAAFMLTLALLFLAFYRFNLEFTQRERAEHVARDIQELVNAFFSSSTVGFAILDPQLRYRRVNEVLAATAGMPPDSLIGKNFRELFGERARLAEPLLQNLISAGVPVLEHEVQDEVPSAPGKSHYWSLNYFPIRNARGEVSQIGLISLDITARKRAEQASRQLSSRLLHLQDEERRRIARELHDSLGQYLTALKINLQLLKRFSDAEQNGGEFDNRFSESLNLVDQCIAETRTLSHLLHPPLLDETGFASAARWYVEGFSKRSGIQVKMEMPAAWERLPEEVEMALFRVLQESLTNVHRHSGSSTAEICLQQTRDHVSLWVRDFGVGIPQDLARRLESAGADAGVGLSGMRERISELKGQLEISSTHEGTEIRIRIPLSHFAGRGAASATVVDSDRAASA